ncbi:hypothetical protein [Bauldia sp.]|uniref:hypothetical protein n=1 Tax=Bauldia sp. TaxID=2575872 RepID=UPI003BAB4989
MAAVFPKSDYRTVEPTVLPNSNKTTCFTVGDEGDDWADVIGIMITGAGTAKVHVKLRASGVECELNDDVMVAAGWPHTIEGFPLHLEAGGTISVEGEPSQVVWISLHRGQRDAGDR